MFEGIKQRLGIGQTLVQPETIDDRIIGYNDIKIFLGQLEASKKMLNVLFNGPPATAKSLFLDELERRYPNPIRYDFGISTGKGVINSLVEFKQEFQERKGLRGKSFEDVPITLLIDEVDAIKPKTDLKMLHNLLEGKRVTYTKFRFRVDLRIPNLRVFATTNYADKLPEPFLSRFFRFDLREYTLEEFIQIAKGIAPKHLNPLRENIDELAEQFAVELYPRDKNVRQLRDMMIAYEVFEGQKTVAEILGFKLKYTQVRDEEQREQRTRTRPESKRKQKKNGIGGAPF